MGIERWTVIDTEDPFERGPRAYFSGTGGSRAEDQFLEAIEFEIDPTDQASVFTHPWLGELRVQYQDTVILTLAERLKDKHVKVSFFDKEESDEQSTLKSVADLSPKNVRAPLAYYPSSFGSLQVEIFRRKKSLSFSFYGLTERVQYTP